MPFSAAMALGGKFLSFLQGFLLLISAMRRLRCVLRAANLSKYRLLSLPGSPPELPFALILSTLRSPFRWGFCLLPSFQSNARASLSETVGSCNLV